MAVVAVAVVAVGIAVYSMTRTVQVPGTKLGDIAQQTAKEGEPRQIIYGIVRPIGGNLVAVQEPPRIERRKQKSGGKGGGGGSSTTIEVPRRTYAIGICEGPVTGIRRAWRNNKLIYDNRGTEWGAKNNGTFLQRFRFYLGGWNQMPDPSLESIFGVGQVPAMRGTCYMVARDEDLQDTGGAVPQWIFEVERAYGYGLTSRPYPVEDIQGGQVTALAVDQAPVYFWAESAGIDSVSVTAGTHRAFRFDLFLEPEIGGQGTLVIAAGTHRTLLQGYPVPAESLENAGLDVPAGAHKQVLRTYDDYEPEALMQSGLSITGGTHATA